MSLNPRRKRFAAEILIDGNATQAAIRSGYSTRGASTRGEELLRNSEVRAAITSGREKQFKRLGRTADDTINLLFDHAEANRCDVWGTRDVTDAETGEVTQERYMRHPLDWPKALQRCVKSFKIIKRNAEAGDGHIDTMWDVQFTDQLKAIVSLGEHHGIFEKDREQANSGLTKLVQELQERRKLLGPKVLLPEAGARAR